MENVSYVGYSARHGLVDGLWCDMDGNILGRSRCSYRLGVKKLEGFVLAISLE